MRGYQYSESHEFLDDFEEGGLEVELGDVVGRKFMPDLGEPAAGRLDADGRPEVAAQMYHDVRPLLVEDPFDVRTEGIDLPHGVEFSAAYREALFRELEADHGRLHCRPDEDKDLGDDDKDAEEEVPLPDRHREEEDGDDDRYPIPGNGLRVVLELRGFPADVRHMLSVAYPPSLCGASERLFSREYARRKRINYLAAELRGIRNVRGARAGLCAAAHSPSPCPGLSRTLRWSSRCRSGSPCS